VFLAGVVVLMAFDEGSRIALYALPFWAAALVGGYFLSKKFNPRHALFERPVIEHDGTPGGRPAPAKAER